MRRARRTLVAICLAGLVLVAASVPGGQGILRTRDGQTLAGELKLRDGLLVVTSTNGTETIVAITNLRQGRFNLTNETAAAAESPAGDTLPAPWLAADIGTVAEPGRATCRNEVFTLHGAGTEFWSMQPDSFFFASQPLKGDGDLVARIVGGDAAAAGIMLRDSAAPDALMAMLFFERGNRVVFRSRRGAKYRKEFHAEGDWHSREEMRLPCLVKLARRGKVVKGYLGWDNGEAWELFYQSPLETTNAVLAGLFVMGGDKSRSKTAAFDRVQLTRKDPENSSAPPVAARCAIVLRDGSVIAGDLKSANDTSVKFSRRGRDFAVATLHVGRILFQDLAAPAGDEALPRGPGLLLSRNDFLDAEFRSIGSGEIKMNSVLFGLKSYKLGQPAKALVLRDLAPGPCAWEIKTLDGSVWRAKSLRTAQDEFVAEVPALGAIRLAAAELTELNLQKEKL